MVYTICLTSLGSGIQETFKKTRIFQENPKTARDYSLVARLPPKRKIL